jgi:hypothetical protein
LKIEENSDTLIDIKYQEMVLSTDPIDMDDTKQPNSIGLNEESISLQVVDDSTCKLNIIFFSNFIKLCCLKDNINPIVSTETEENTYSNHDSGKLFGLFFL